MDPWPAIDPDAPPIRELTAEHEASISVPLKFWVRPDMEPLPEVVEEVEPAPDCEPDAPDPVEPEPVEPDRPDWLPLVLSVCVRSACEPLLPRSL